MSTTAADATSDSPTDFIDVHVVGGTPASSTTPRTRSLTKPIEPVPPSPARALPEASKQVDEAFQAEALRREIERLKGENDAYRQSIEQFNKRQTDMSKKIVELEVRLAQQGYELKGHYDKINSAALREKETELLAFFEAEKKKLLDDIKRRQNYRA